MYYTLSIYQGAKALDSTSMGNCCNICLTPQDVLSDKHLTAYRTKSFKRVQYGGCMHVIEEAYPISFRKGDAKALGEHIRHHNSVALIGVKRVGISNFLRFFLHHPKIQETYIHNGMTHYFIPVDLNDLVERDIFPFWTLVLTRLVDVIEESKLSENTKTTSSRLFRESIQLKDLFFTVDSVRKIAALLTAQGIYPTFFFIRFDRIKDAITPEFFSNLQSIHDAAKQKLSYVFTSFRPLHQLAPDVFSKTSLSVFSHDLFIQPAKEADLRMILHTFQDRYHLKLPEKINDWLISLSGGHVQYLQLALIRLRDEKRLPQTKQELLDMLCTNEEIILQSEELFESLNKTEQDILVKIAEGKHVYDGAPYVWDTGMVKNNQLFCPLLTQYLQKKQKGLPAPHTEFTKKEHLLFSFLKSKLGELAEREDIISAVWPEFLELGVSDWAIDRLVARVRTKLKTQKSSYEIITVITRGYKLVNT